MKSKGYKENIEGIKGDIDSLISKKLLIYFKLIEANTEEKMNKILK